MLNLSDKVFWVTGSSRGIGSGVARHLAEHGASIVVHGRSTESLAPIIAELSSITQVLGIAADVRDEQSLILAVKQIEERFGRLDGVVANVGGAAYGDMGVMTLEKFRKQIDLNLTSSFATAQASYRLLKESRGAVVLISATAATSATPMFGPYGAAKAAVEHLTKSLAAEWGPFVRVNCVSPGLIRTEGSMAAVFKNDLELAQKAGSTTAVGRIGEITDIAWACHFLLCDAASFINGTTLVVDGGPTDGPTQRILRALNS